jgi:small subunit ribosomal protein S17
MRSKKGTVVSVSGNKTIVVEVNTYRQHSKYKKRFRVTSKFHAHDEEEKFKTGDEVTIYETRPLSKMKRWTTGSELSKELPTKKEGTKSNNTEK